MNRGFVGILSLLLIAIFIAVLVFRKKSEATNGKGDFYNFVPGNFTEEIIEVNNPNIAIEQLLSSNLIWKDSKTDFDAFEKFWLQKDSGFNQIKNVAEYLCLFSNKNQDFYLFKLPYSADSLTFSSSYKSFIHQNFILFSTSGLESFKKSFEEEMPLGESTGFQKVLTQKIKNKEGVKLYLKKELHWNFFELNFLPEQVFANGNISKSSENRSYSGLLDLVVMDYLPVQFQTINFTQFNSVNAIIKDSNYLNKISKNCECDAEYSLYNWMSSPQINLTLLNDSSPIFATKINELSSFTEGLNRIISDSIDFELENKSISKLGIKLKLGKSKIEYQYILRIDEYVYFGANKGQLEKLNSRIFSELTMGSNDELMSFIGNNLNKKSYRIEINKGINLASIKNSNGISLYQESNQNIEFNYLSFIYSKEIEIGKGIVNPKWTKKFANPLKNAIYKVKNHRTNDYNYLVQDEKNIIYFISPNGDVNWEKDVKNPIIGDIKNIDLLGNKKNQLIFNTKNQLYIIDILSRNVGDFPVIIKDSATGNVSVIDYDDDLSFRFLIPTTVGIKSINKKGEIVSGWSQPKTNNYIYQDIEHLSINGLDYLFVRDNKNRTYYYNRKGEVRHRVEAVFGEPFYLLYGSTITNTRAIFLDKKENTISKQFFDDKPVSILLSPQKIINQFFFVDYNNNNERDFILVFDDEIVVYGQDLIIREKISLPKTYQKLKIWKEGYCYINELDELTVNMNNKKNIIEGVESYRIDTYKNKNRVLVKQGNSLKLLHLR